ncbi:hypothetical protein CG51_00355 [Haematobacter missouriensis]|uniref:N-terminal of MaoC-like dehydratase domain-containing protein n=1 Tax=Haematobacter missouriensis TaxID=366616 RepID=A0A212AID9_9RHOB|nr:hypothetical protein [Haematobacter missouriensis]KFI32698.1 hypothetical protein CG51_00355 [Haematobacter missouriensis]OWJ79117.1 hypothetical protein CDV53_02190 [Haematobacter missouriensis]OWJ81261.1 hypothetical protein CDV52_18510 [Haematobacter missouriensis]
MTSLFPTPLTETDGWLTGPLRAPAQMLSAQNYDGHASIHDDRAAQTLGFKGGTIEGPTHFSQFDPLAVRLFGDRWLAAGCISAHFRNPAFEGDRLRAMARQVAPDQAEIRMEREDGTEILRGSLSIGPDHPVSALEERMAALPPLEGARILADVRVGMRTPRRPISMGFDQNMGHLYPFSLSEKLSRITEPSPAYRGAVGSWREAVIPFEMLSVLFCYTNKQDPFPVRGPAIGLFADQEIRLLDGPIFVGEPLEIAREVIALSGSRRTESMWVRSSIHRHGMTAPAATMLLNLASLKDSYKGDVDKAATA